MPALQSDWRISKHHWAWSPEYLLWCANLLYFVHKEGEAYNDGSPQRLLVKCKVESVPCQYQSVGCTARPKRQDLSQHNLKAMSDHLLLAVTAIANQRTELGQQTKAIAQQRTEIAELRREHQEIKNSFRLKRISCTSRN